jgi:LDH2 family malate/lactate/ureidoglycolate dehydrogenase
MVILNDKILKELGRDIFVAAGVNKAEADWVSDCLVLSNLKGVDSHGVQQIPGYIKAIQTGVLKPGAEVKLVKESSATSFYDGSWGFGYSVAKKVMEVTLEKAKRAGIAYSGIQNIHHIGRVGRWAEMALEKNMLGIASQPGGVYIAPWGGIDRKLAIAPIAFAIPTEKHPPIVVDMSLGPIAGGRTAILAVRGMKVPFGWYVDDEGKPSNDPKLFNMGKGAQLPLGQTGLGYKGMALSMIIEILTGPLLGLMAKPEARTLERRGVFLGAINIEAFTEIEVFKMSIDTMISDVKSSRLAEGFEEILMPGEPEYREEKRRRVEGIYLDESVYEKILDTAKSLGIQTNEYDSKPGKLEIKHPSYTLKHQYRDG